MLRYVKQFIENNIDLIESQKFDQVFSIAETTLTRQERCELLSVLESALKIDFVPHIHKYLKQYANDLLDGWSTSTVITVKQFVTSYMPTCERPMEEVQNIVMDVLKDHPELTVKKFANGAYNIIKRVN